MNDNNNNNILLFTKNNMILTLKKELNITKRTIICSNEFLRECKSFASDSKFVIEFIHGYDVYKIDTIIKSLLGLLSAYPKTITLKIIYYSKKISHVLKQIVMIGCFSKIIFGKKFASNKFSFKNMSNVKEVEYLGHWTNIELLPKFLNLITLKINKNKNKDKNITLFLPEHLQKIKIIESRVCCTDISFFSYDVKNIFVVRTKKNLVMQQGLECLVFSNYVNDGDLFSTLIDNLPNTIKMLFLPNGYDKPVDFLPDSLKCLSLGKYYKQPLNNLPSSLNRLFIFCNMMQDLDFFSRLPDSIEFIIIKDTMCKTDIGTNKLNKLPSSLKEITFQNKFSKNYYHVIQPFYQYKIEKNANFILS